MEQEWFATKYPNRFLNKKGEMKVVYKSREPQIFKGSMSGSGYLAFSMPNREKVCVHRLMGETFLSNPHNLRNIDHIDRNKLNNNLDNLRWFSQNDNMTNRGQIKGIALHNGKWLAKMGIDVLGSWDTKEEAIACKYGYMKALKMSIDDDIFEYK